MKHSPHLLFISASLECRLPCNKFVKGKETTHHSPIYLMVVGRKVTYIHGKKLW